MMFIVDFWEKFGWIRLSGKIIFGDIIWDGVFEGIYNRIENFLFLDFWFYFGLECESKDIINIGWVGKWFYWS